MTDSPSVQPIPLLMNRIRHTRWLVALLLPLIVLVAPPARPSWVHYLAEILAVTCLVVCLVGRAWCLIYIAGRKNIELVTLGPYSVTRNPLYIFSSIGVVGIGLTTGMLSLLALALAVFVPYYGLVVRREERYLAGQHGAAYDDYRAKVPRWIPDFSQWRDSERLDVRPRYIIVHILDSSLFFLAYVLHDILSFLRETQVVIPLLILP